MIAGLVGPLFYRRWFSRGPIDEEFITTTVKNVIRGRQTTGDSGPDAHTDG